MVKRHLGSHFVLAVTLNTLLVTAAIAVGGPSFACNGVKGVAAVVCSSQVLSAKDRRMDALYRVARVSVIGGGPSGEVQAQREWLHETESACAIGGKAEPCISTAYDYRNDELAVEALFGAHEIAMEQLKGPAPGMDQAPARSRVSPGSLAEEAANRQRAAALYEAIYAYATIDPVKARVAAVAPLIAPLFANIKGKSSITPIEEQERPEDAVSSDSAFATFLAVASVSVGNASVTLPCEALIRRPGLIHVLEGYYGGAIDGFLIDTTCAKATSYLPAFDALVQTAIGAQEPCTGSIRISLWRDTLRVLTAIRLHRMDVLSSEAPPNHGQSADRILQAAPSVAKFFADHAQAVNSAVDEIAAYFETAFHAARQSARSDARFAVVIAVQSVFDGCE